MSTVEPSMVRKVCMPSSRHSHQGGTSLMPYRTEPAQGNSQRDMLIRRRRRQRPGGGARATKGWRPGAAKCPWPTVPFSVPLVAAAMAPLSAAAGGGTPTPLSSALHAGSPSSRLRWWTPESSMAGGKFCETKIVCPGSWPFASDRRQAGPPHAGQNFDEFHLILRYYMMLLVLPAATITKVAMSLLLPPPLMLCRYRCCCCCCCHCSCCWIWCCCCCCCRCCVWCRCFCRRRCTAVACCRCAAVAAAFAASCSVALAHRRQRVSAPHVSLFHGLLRSKEREVTENHQAGQVG